MHDLTRPETRDHLHPARFRTPARTERPGFRWWWTVPVATEELVRELGAIADAGFGEVEIAFSPEFWGDEAQREALAAVLAEAERLEVGVAATVGAAWPLQTPNTTKGTEYAAKELQYGVVFTADLDAGPDAAASLAVPGPFDDPDNARGAVLHAVTGARVVERGEPSTLEQGTTWYGAPHTSIVTTPRSTVLDPGSVIDLTDTVTDGTVRRPDADGAWAVFGFWMRDCTQGVTSFLDCRAAVAATEYLDEHQFGADNLAAFGRIGTEWFEDSLELNADSLFWTPDLLDRFRDRHGYDLTPWLPIAFAHGMCRYWVPNSEPRPDFVFADGSDAGVRADYHRLITDLYIADHLLVLQEWSVAHGVRHKAQVAYGQNLEPVRSNRDFVRAGGRAEGESLNAGDRAPVSRQHPTWRFAVDWQRSVVGGAHQGGATRISSELGAQFGVAFAQTLGDLKQMLDKEWSAGITKPFVHGFAAQPADAVWPTHSRFSDFVTESWNDRHYPEWTHFAPLADYWARGTVVLETGTPRTDVAILRDGFLTTAARGMDEQDATVSPMLADTEALERRGYGVQYLDPIGLAEPGCVGEGVLYPAGPAYRGLVVDARVTTPDAAEAVLRAAEGGVFVVVVGDAPAGDVGFASGAEGDARVRAAFERLAGRPGVSAVASMAAVADAFAALGLVPRAAWDGPLLFSQWRDAGERSYVLVYHADAEEVGVRLSLEGEGAVSELDLWTGATRPLAARASGGRTEVYLDVGSLGLRVLELDRSGSTAQSPSVEDPSSVERGELLHLETIDTAWELTVVSLEPDGPRTINLPGQGPADWRDIEQLRTVSGVGIYRARVEALNDAVLELGDLFGSATIRVDGELVSTVYTSGERVSLRDALAAGGELTVEVRTVLNNAVSVVKRPGFPGPSDGSAPPRPLVAQGWAGPARLRGTTERKYVSPTSEPTVKEQQ